MCLNTYQTKNFPCNLQLITNIINNTLDDKKQMIISFTESYTQLISIFAKNPHQSSPAVVHLSTHIPTRTTHRMNKFINHPTTHFPTHDPQSNPQLKTARISRN